MERKEKDFKEMIIDVEVWEIKNINRIIYKLKERERVRREKSVKGQE